MVLLDLGSSWITPPWLPLLMVVILLGVIGFLYWSMRRNLGRIRLDESASPEAPVSPTDEPHGPGRPAR